MPFVGKVLTRVSRFTCEMVTAGGVFLRKIPQPIAAAITSGSKSSSFFKRASPTHYLSWETPLARYRARYFGNTGRNRLLESAFLELDGSATSRSGISNGEGRRDTIRT